MENDIKYSGKLPLLAYAPQNFGHPAQRSRAYRARAAMGRTGIYSAHRTTVSSASAPVATHADSTKQPIAASKPVERVDMLPQTGMLRSLWQLICTGFGRESKVVRAADSRTELQHAGQTSPIMPHADIFNSQKTKPAKAPEPAVTGFAHSVEPLPLAPAPVSKAYAALRVTSASMTPEHAVGANKAPHIQEVTDTPLHGLPQPAEISQAPDLAHALAEVRAALHEHERLAAEKIRNQQ